MEEESCSWSATASRTALVGRGWVVGDAASAVVISRAAEVTTTTTTTTRRGEQTGPTDDDVQRIGTRSASKERKKDLSGYYHCTNSCAPIG
jgi:N-acetylglucosamine kinase-like BadF-type ATPase